MNICCRSCEKYISPDMDKYKVMGPWDRFSGEYDCAGCAERHLDDYNESMVF